MKKRLITLAILVCLICSAAVSASGEMLYSTLKSLLSDPESGDYYLGTPSSTSLDQGSKYCMIVYDNDDSDFTLISDTVCCWWNDISLSKGFYVIYGFCGIWDTLEKEMDPGYELVMGITNNEETTWITSSSEAASFVSATEDWLNSKK